MKYEIEKTAQFDKWFKDLRDMQAKARIGIRLKRVAEGNFGDAKSVGDNVSELRFFFGPGYRVYYTIQGKKVVILLNGGDKDSQESDIENAKQLAEELE